MSKLLWVEEARNRIDLRAPAVHSHEGDVALTRVRYRLERDTGEQR